MKRLFGKIAAGFAFGLAGTTAIAQAPVLSVVYSFAGPANDGATSVAPLITDSAGNLYGTTSGGGNTTCNSSGCGTVFKIDPLGNESVLYKFSGPDGAFPAGGLVMDSSGNLYGTTVSGGSGGLCRHFGCGTVYKVDPAGNFTLLHAFTESATDGGNPTAGLIIDSSNHLYGTTGFGGSSGTGTVFVIDTSGNNMTLLHSFSPADGTEPSAPLIMDSANNLYSTTYSGGAGGVGTVFKLNIASGTFTVLHAFNLSTDGGNSSAAVVMDSAGNLYGTTAGTGAGGSYGALFRIDMLGNFSVLHAFAQSVDGAYLPTEGRPAPGLVMDAAGNLYGTTEIGGVQAAQTSAGGTIFEFSSGSLTTLYTFYCTFTGCPHGVYPSAGLVEDAGGNFDGTTTSGGSIGYGTVFKLVVQNPPAIAGLSPASAIAGGPAFTLTVTGTNFVSGTTVNFNGNALTTTFVSATQLTAMVPASDISAPGNSNITVTNPGGSISNTLTFTVVTPQAATQVIGNSVSALYSQRVINGGQYNSLIGQIQHAISMINAGKVNGAIGNLQAFESEVNDLLGSGVLSAPQASSLNSAAQSVIAAL